MKRFILTAVSFMTLLCSCENFIDLQPMDKITMDDYCEIMITFDNLAKERMDHIVLVWEHYDVLGLSVRKMEQWLNAIVEYTQHNFTHEHSLIIFNKPQHYSHASIIPTNQVQEDSIEIFSIIFSDS